MPFIYHYHAIGYPKDEPNIPGETIHIEGVLTCEDRIDTMARYLEAKKVIAGEHFNAGKSVVTSLSFLHDLNLSWHQKLRCHLSFLSG